MASTEIHLLLCNSHVPPLKSWNQSRSNCSLPSLLHPERFFSTPKALQYSNRGVNNLENPPLASQTKKSQYLLSQSEGNSFINHTIPVQICFTKQRGKYILYHCRKNKAQNFPSFLLYFYPCIAVIFPRSFTGIMISFICRNTQFFILLTPKEIMKANIWRNSPQK